MRRSYGRVTARDPAVESRPLRDDGSPSFRAMMKNAILTSSFIFSVPPAMEAISTPKSVCLILKSPYARRLSSPTTVDLRQRRTQIGLEFPQCLLLVFERGVTLL